MSFTLELTADQEALREKTHAFARHVVRPAAAEYDRTQELPRPILQEAARQGLYNWELYAELSVDPTGLSLPILMEELFWGCAGIGLSIVMRPWRWPLSARPPRTSSSSAGRPSASAARTTSRSQRWR